MARPTVTPGTPGTVDPPFSLPGLDHVRAERDGAQILPLLPLTRRAAGNDPYAKIHRHKIGDNVFIGDHLKPVRQSRSGAHSPARVLILGEGRAALAAHLTGKGMYTFMPGEPAAPNVYEGIVATSVIHQLSAAPSFTNGKTFPTGRVTQDGDALAAVHKFAAAAAAVTRRGSRLVIRAGIIDPATDHLQARATVPLRADQDLAREYVAATGAPLTIHEDQVTGPAPWVHRFLTTWLWGRAAVDEQARSPFLLASPDAITDAITDGLPWRPEPGGRTWTSPVYARAWTHGELTLEHEHDTGWVRSWPVTHALFVFARTSDTSVRAHASTGRPARTAQKESQ